MAKIHTEAPRVAVEWLTPGSATPMAIADGQVDFALLRSATTMPDGIERHDAGALKVWTYLRKDIQRLRPGPRRVTPVAARPGDAWRPAAYVVGYRHRRRERQADDLRSGSVFLVCARLAGAHPARIERLQAAIAPKEPYIIVFVKDGQTIEDALAACAKARGITPADIHVPVIYITETESVL